MTNKILFKKYDKFGCIYCKNELLQANVDIYENDIIDASQVKSIDDRLKQPENGHPSYCPDCQTNLISGFFDIHELNEDFLNFLRETRGSKND